MKKGTTKSGFKYEVDEGITDDMELVDALADLNNGNLYAMPTVVTMVLGEKQKQRLYDHVRDENGRVHASDISREVVEIINSVGKKSSPSPT